VLCISILIALILRYPTVVTCLICVYLMYFGVIAFYVLRLSAKMKKSYKSLVQVTILVVTIALLLLIAKQFHTSILLIVAEFSLYNGYMVLVAALYAPFIAPKTKTSREGEQDSIMQ
jgi:chromate transport protein ChrA